IPLGGSLLNVFHSTVGATAAALPLVMERWSGPVGVYPEAARRDYTATWRDPTIENALTPKDFASLAWQWVAQGVQVIGGRRGSGEADGLWVPLGRTPRPDNRRAHVSSPTGSAGRVVRAWLTHAQVSDVPLGGALDGLGALDPDRAAVERPVHPLVLVAPEL